MDLLDRGRSLSELGRTLRWSDLNALIIHLPATSHMHQVLDPVHAQEIARIEQWTAPEVIILGAIFDTHEAQIFARAQEEAPKQGIVSRMLQKISTSHQSEGEKIQERRPVASASEIRQAVKARETASSD